MWYSLLAHSADQVKHGTDLEALVSWSMAVIAVLSLGYIVYIVGQHRGYEAGQVAGKNASWKYWEQWHDSRLRLQVAIIGEDYAERVRKAVAAVDVRLIEPEPSDKE